MIHVPSERLLPLADLPTHLESRGFGSRVSMRTVKRWTSEGYNGARLETIRIGRSTMTSHEAVQRWVAAQTMHNPVCVDRQSPTEPVDTAAPEQLASLHLLTEHRVIPTELDQAILALDLPRTTLAYTAGILFRAGLRTRADARRKGLRGLMAIQGLGIRSALVIRGLLKALRAGSRTPPTAALPR